MRNTSTCIWAAASCAVLLPATGALADGTRFSDYTPLTGSAGPTSNEATPITLSNAKFAQRSIASRLAQLAAEVPNSGAWDQITSNETGGQKGRYLFTVFETGQAGVQRHDLLTGSTETLWNSIAVGHHVSFDASYWTPWGTFITAEESWETVAGGSTSPYGRLFELRNPLEATGIVGPIPADESENAIFVHRNVVPRTSHEGIQFDADGNMYFIDEL